MSRRDERRSVCLIGCGYWGKNLLRVLNEFGALHTVCESDNDRLEALRKQYGELDYTNDIGVVLADENITSMVISTPAATHFEMARLSLLHGKDVFVEKPLAMRVEEGEELVRLAGEKKRILMVGHIIQYHPAIQKLKGMIAGGELGKLQYIYSNRVNLGKLRTEENILWSFAPHDISVILMLLNEEPVKVCAFGGAYLNEGIYDTTLTELKFANGVRGHIFVSWLHPYKEQKLIVVGSRAMAVFDDMSSDKLYLYQHEIAWKDGKIPVANRGAHQVVPFKMEEPLKLEVEHFLTCVKGRDVPRTDGHEGLRVLNVLQLAERSLREEG